MYFRTQWIERNSLKYLNVSTNVLQVSTHWQLTRPPDSIWYNTLPLSVNDCFLPVTVNNPLLHNYREYLFINFRVSECQKSNWQITDSNILESFILFIGYKSTLNNIQDGNSQGQNQEYKWNKAGIIFGCRESTSIIWDTNPEVYTTTTKYSADKADILLFLPR